MKLLFISGKFNSGKTTLSNNLYECQELSKKYNLLTYAFADYPKEIMSDILEKPYQYFNEDKNEITEFDFKTKRQLMQYLFADVFCQLNPNIWAHKVYKQILINKKRYCRNYSLECLHVISDWRKVSEYEYLTKMLKDKIYSVKTLRINNSNLANTDEHISEVNLDNFRFDSVIDVANLEPKETLNIVLQEFNNWGW